MTSTYEVNHLTALHEPTFTSVEAALAEVQDGHLLLQTSNFETLAAFAPGTWQNVVRVVADREKAAA